MKDVEEKKEYVAPQMTVVEMACTGFLCGSGDIGDDTEVAPEGTFGD